jgi:transglutaminase-like putative cysteine protease
MGEWGNVSIGQTTAFTDSVTLGVGGLISESQAEVLDLAVTNRLGQNIGSADRIFYLRGAVLDTYDDGRWTLGADRTFTRQHVIEDVAANVGGRRPSDADVSARVTIRNASERLGYLFTIWRPNQIILHDPGGFIELGPHSVIRRDSPTGKYEYTIRCDTSGRGPARSADLARQRSAYSRRIQTLADEILTRAGIDPEPATRSPDADEQAARALESHLRLNYAYTLEITAAPAGRDATEHFLFTSREGHCEYFASALASMCRAVGIEARVVTGYVAAEFLEGASKYVVRESNAHAWVEVPLSRGQWVTLDATPPADLTRIHQPTLGPLARIRRAFDSIELAWIHGVVGFDERSRASVLGRQPVNPRRIEERMADFNLRMSVGGLSLATRAARNALLTFGGVALIGFGLSIVISTLRTRWRVMRAIRAARRVDPTIGVPVQDAGLFARLQAILAQKGRPRPTWMGALDHAAMIAKEDPSAPPAPDLVRLYYTARFGGHPINAAQSKSARRALQSIRLAMVRKPRPRRP